MKDKATIIPGWLGTVKNYNRYAGLEIWEEDIPEEHPIETEYVIGHSLGAHFAVLNWEKNGNTKIILVNPLLVKRSSAAWFWRWLKFALSERHEWRNKIFHPLKILRGVKKCRDYLQIDLAPIIKRIPPEHIAVIRGKDDNFFCDKETADLIRSLSIKLIEVEDTRHNWYEKEENINKEIGDIINKQ